MKSKFLNRLEMFNETIITIVAYHYLFFTDWMFDEKLKYKYGWSCIGVTCLYILVNQYFFLRIGYQTLDLVRLKL